MAHRTARQLLRELSTPARSALRLPTRSTILAPRRTASTYGREPPPQPQTPSQQLAERALLQKLSTLSPDQISALLSAPPDAPIPPRPTGAYHQPPAPEPTPRWKRLLLGLAIGTVSLLVGHELGEMLIDSSDLLTWAARGVELPEGDEAMSPRDRAAALFEYLDNVPRMEFLMPKRAVYHITEDGIIYILRPEVSADLLRALASKPPPGYHPQARTVISSDEGGIPHYIDSGPPHECETFLAVPEAMSPLNISDPLRWAHSESHLMTGTFNTPNTLGLLNHGIVDHMTGKFLCVAVFGRRMCGWPGVVHGGALATAVLDSSMCYDALGFFGEVPFRPSKLTITYHHPLSPCSPVFIKAEHTEIYHLARQEFLSQMERKGPEALANALKPVSHPSKRMSAEAREALIQEVIRKKDARENLVMHVRMWSEENGGLPICDAQVTFVKMTPEEEAEAESLKRSPWTTLSIAKSDV